jgi:hypothetical protein
VAGNLGAQALADAALTVENAIRAGGDVTLEALTGCLADVMAVIAGAKMSAQADNTGQTPGEADPVTVVPALRRLKRLLETDDGEAADFMLDIEAGLASVLTESEVEHLSRSVGEFDFAAALAALGEIVQRLSLDLECDSSVEP